MEGVDFAIDAPIIVTFIYTTRTKKKEIVLVVT